MGWLGPWLEVGLGLLSRCPLPWLHGIAQVIGYSMASWPLRLNRVIAANLARVFPQLPDRQRRALHRRTLAELAKAVLELSHFWQADERALWRRLRVTNEAQFRAAAVNGAVLITPHWGAWELAGLYASRHYPMMILQRENRLGFTAFLAKYRGRFGGVVANANAAGLKQLLAALKAKQIIGLLPDQVPPQAQGIWADFCGQSAYTSPLAVRLAQRCHVPLVLLTARRLGGGRYHLDFQLIDGAAPLEDAVQRMNDAMSHLILDCPAQYLWSYNRFKSPSAVSVVGFSATK